MAYNYSKLLGKIVEVFNTRRAFAKEMNLSERTISLKLSNEVEWKQGEIKKACNLLGINEDQIVSFFLTNKFNIELYRV